MRLPQTGLKLAIILSFAFFCLAADTPSYQQSVEKWRQAYEAKLRGDDGWLTVSALLWLHEGQNTFGSGVKNDIVLAYPSVPPVAGTFEHHAGKTIAHVKPGTVVTMNGKPVTDVELPADSRQHRLVIGDITFYVHASGDRFAIRVKDKNSKLRREFTGTVWYPVNEGYRFQAKFVPYEKPRPVEIDNVIGDHDQIMVAGYVAFKLKGEEFRLEAEQDQSGNLFIVFRDLTSAKESYPAARFLDTDPPKDGTVEVDFNKAYNPPCAYNPYTTCPLPVPGNRMKIEIPAGEKRYHH